MSEEKLASTINDARLLNACDNVLYPMLERKITLKLKQACAKFRGNEKDFVAEIAYITAIEDLLHELKAKQTQGHKAIQKLHVESGDI